MCQHIKDWCYAECERQHATTPGDISNMLEAWEWAEAMQNCTRGLSIDLTDIQELGRRVDPIANPGGRFRTGPAVFMDGGRAADAKDISELLTRLISVYFGEPEFEPGEFYQELMYIHPFKDGNGRVGALVYNILNGTIDNPVPSPEYR